MQRKITIAIDGHSSTGKSTAAKQLAQELGYLYVDTGAMYRAVSFFALRESLINNGILDTTKLEDRLKDITITFERNPENGNNEVCLNGKNIEKEIRTLKVSNVVSKIAEVSTVRSKLVEQQQKMGAEKGVVMDGRDIGTVVFPNAELKVFMTAAADERAKRRYDELKKRGDKVEYDDVLKNVIERDHIDSNREDSPLVQAEDALLLDTSHMDRDEQFDTLLHWAKEELSK
ncbi:cytidylate kinase [Nonlabens sp. Hel1_33_55]|uniref:(d)CMP kinase n=1 Tax=Nonlabens sp. Hel1_33_55 TaxID=1336802 RepID=UPI000875F043|nr:(d)CMP kinase [Nonlabens sp. Hel1_33_55]SCY12407.1 cytidylate kinase [Nonlabens sp. Hel1_33_55]